MQYFLCLQLNGFRIYVTHNIQVLSLVSYLKRLQLFKNIVLYKKKNYIILLEFIGNNIYIYTQTHTGGFLMYQTHVTNLHVYIYYFLWK